MRSWVAIRPLMPVIVLACLLAAPLGRAQAPHPPRMASPDWRDQVIYFLMIDRFDDGDPGNNDQGAGEYDPADGAKYSGTPKKRPTGKSRAGRDSGSRGGAELLTSAMLRGAFRPVRLPYGG